MDSLLSGKADLTSLNQMNKRIKKLESMIESYEKSAVMQESYDKRLNILIHGTKEDNDSPWEKQDTTVTKFQEFLKKGLKIDDPEDIEFVDIHRLPQYPVKKMVDLLADQ